MNFDNVIIHYYPTTPYIAQSREGKSKMNGYTITFKDFPKTYRFYVAASDEFQAVARASARADKEIGKDFSWLCIMAGKMRIEKE